MSRDAYNDAWISGYERGVKRGGEGMLRDVVAWLRQERREHIGQWEDACAKLTDENERLRQERDEYANEAAAQRNEIRQLMDERDEHMKDAMDRDKLAEELAWHKAAYERNARLTGSERAPEATCPKHAGCLPETCGDCPDDEPAKRSRENQLFAERFPERVGHIGTHYPECYKSHPSCAWRVGWSDGIEHVVWMLRNTEGPMTSEGIYTGPSSGTLDALAEWIEGMA